MRPAYIEQLERLRREQRREQDRRIPLYAPVPRPEEERLRRREDRRRDEPLRGVVEIDFTL